MAPPDSQDLRVPQELDGARLDRALVALVGGRPRERYREMILDGLVRVDGEPVARPAQLVHAGQRIVLELIERERQRRGAAPAAGLEVLHLDEEVAVVNKQAGMIVHPGPTVKGGTLSEMAELSFGPLPSPQGEDRQGIVHRLDAETSGVIVLARTEAAARELMRQFREREVEKRYLALVHGDPRFDSDWIEKPMARSERRGDRMAVVKEGGREAATFYRVLERFGELALLACEPRTGRTHQIRVHLASIGHPVVGDRLYRGRKTLKLPPGAPRPGRHALHAERLSFCHPASEEARVFEAPLPEDLARLLEWFRERATARDAASES